MRHFRGSRGSRRSSMPRSSISKKYIVDNPQASQTAGKNDLIIVRGLDNATLGQVSAVDEDVPVGAKVGLLDIRAGYQNLDEASVVFVYWTIQRLRSQQTSVAPISPGGNPNVRNIMLSGIRAVAPNQNTVISIRYKIPKSMQRMADLDQWMWTTETTNSVTRVAQFVYKVFM